MALLLFHVKEFENIGGNHIGLFFRQITQLPFGCSDSILPPLPLQSNFQLYGLNAGFSFA